jgi:DNA-binding NarL/FixJ family response regulator
MSKGRQGARAWGAGPLPTSLEPAEAAGDLQCVAALGTFVPAGAMIKLAQDRKNGSRPAAERESRRLRDLTQRESAVLARLRQGKPNKIIARELEISESTVKAFVRGF